MLREPDRVRAFEDESSRLERADESVNRQVFARLLAEACSLGALPPADPLEGIEVDIRLARSLHAARPAS